MKNGVLRKSFWISFIYVGLSLIGLLGMLPNGMFGGQLTAFISPLLFLLTLPVSFISFGILYSEPNSTMTIIINSNCHFLLALGDFFCYLQNKNTSKSSKTDNR